MLPELDLLYALRRHGVPFVTIGGHAVAVHGHIRATEDTDVVWLRTAESEAGLLAMLQDVQGRYLTADIDSANGLEREHPVTSEFIRDHRVMMLWTNHGFLDLFDHVPGFPSSRVEELMETRVEVHGLPFVSFDWLLRMKRSSGRTKDVLDLERLPEACSRP